MIILTAESVGQKGEGIARYQGMPVFVPGLLPGESASVEITERRSSYARGTITNLLSSSEDRRQAFCPVFGSCGGCHLQHWDYHAGLSWKRDYLKSLFRHQGHLDVEVSPVIPSPVLHGVRNKVQLPLEVRNNRVASGFYAPRSHNLIPIDNCPMQSDLANEAMQQLLCLFGESAARDSMVEKYKHMLRHLILRSNCDDNQIQVIVVIDGDYLPGEEVLSQRLADMLPELSGFIINQNRLKGNRILNGELRTVWGSSIMRDRIGKFRFNISPGSFFQTNRFLSETLYTTALDQANLMSEETVAELFCGVGTISVFIAERVKAVLSVEDNPVALSEARSNAMLNQMTNIRCLPGAAETVLPALLRDGFLPDTILVDPPRSGCAPELLQAVIEADITKLEYISCNSATLVRDAVILNAAGYKMSSVQPIDMFPWTEHLESCCCFSRQY